MPTVTIVSDRFVSLAKSVSSARGFSKLPIAIIPHPLGGLSSDEVKEKADRVFDAVVKALSAAG